MKLKLIDLYISAESVKGSQFVQIIRNHHWMVTDSGKVMVYGSLQCNPSRELCESMVKYWLEKFELVVHVEFHPVVLVPIDPQGEWKYEV